VNGGPASSPFQLPRFYPILDTSVVQRCGLSALAAAEAALEAGVQILQYRHKEAWTQAEFDEAKAISELCRSANVLFVLNDRADFASLIDAGLHLGQDDLPPVAARKILPGQVIGFSTHNRGQLNRAKEEPVEYLAIGPIFATASKLRPDPVLGVEGLRKLRPLANKPVVVIGGIALDNAQQALEAGADSLATIAGWLSAGTNRQGVRQRLEEWLRQTADSRPGGEGRV
jgi:thiamine-phosphate pyrophosphorylase